MKRLFKTLFFSALLGFALGLIVQLTYNHFKEHKFLPPTYDGINADYKHSPMVRLHDKDGKFFCSGAVIADNYVLTAAHCVYGETIIQVHTDKDIVIKESTSKHSKANNRIDVAVIEGNFSTFNRADVDVSAGTVLANVDMAAQGAPVVACGFPMGGEPTCAFLRNIGQFGFALAANGYLYPGMSGGPVINGATGHVFAINQAVLEGPGVLVMPLVSLWESLDIPTK